MNHRRGYSDRRFRHRSGTDGVDLMGDFGLFFRKVDGRECGCRYHDIWTMAVHRGDDRVWITQVEGWAADAHEVDVAPLSGCVDQAARHLSLAAGDQDLHRRSAGLDSIRQELRQCSASP